MVTRSFENAFPFVLRRTLVSTAALALLVAAGSCDSDSSGNASTGSANVKFCNNLTSQAGPLELILLIGNPPVMLKASSGQCSSAVGASCASVSAGVVPWRVLLDGKSQIDGATTMFKDDQFVFLATVENAQPIIADDLIDDGTKCPQVDRFAGAAPGAGGTGGTLPPRAGNPTRGSVIPLPFDAEAYRHLGLERHSPR
jgi:hypothetical protein